MLNLYKILGLALTLAIFAVSVHAAQPAYLTIQIDGKPIKLNASKARNLPKPAVKAERKGSGMATGRRTYEPIVIRKRVDKSSPLLKKAAKNRSKIKAKLEQSASDGTYLKYELINVKVTNYNVNASSNYEVFTISYTGLE